MLSADLPPVQPILGGQLCVGAPSHTLFGLGTPCQQWCLYWHKSMRHNAMWVLVKDVSNLMHNQQCCLAAAWEGPQVALPAAVKCQQAHTTCCAAA